MKKTESEMIKSSNSGGDIITKNDPIISVKESVIVKYLNQERVSMIFKMSSVLLTSFWLFIIWIMTLDADGFDKFKTAISSSMTTITLVISIFNVMVILITNGWFPFFNERQRIVVKNRFNVFYHVLGVCKIKK